MLVFGGVSHQSLQGSDFGAPGLLDLGLPDSDDGHHQLSANRPDGRL